MFVKGKDSTLKAALYTRCAGFQNLLGYSGSDQLETNFAASFNVPYGW